MTALALAALLHAAPAPRPDIALACIQVAEQVVCQWVRVR